MIDRVGITILNVSMDVAIGGICVSHAGHVIEFDSNIGFHGISTYVACMRICASFLRDHVHWGRGGNSNHMVGMSSSIV